MNKKQRMVLGKAKDNLKKSKKEKFQNVYVDGCEISWWLDFKIACGSQLLFVYFEHLRVKYENEVDNQIDDSVFDEIDSFFLKNPEPIYRKVGKSRKKIVGYKNLNFGENVVERAKKRREIVEQELLNSSVSVSPSVHLHSNQYGRFLTIVTDEEIVTKEKEEQFLEKVCKHIKDGHIERLINKDIVYTAENWKAESALRQQCKEARANWFKEADLP